MNLTINAEEVRLTPSTYYKMCVHLDDVDVSSLVEEIGTEEFMKHARVSEILEYIDIDTIVDHFGAQALLNEIKSND